MTDAKAVSAKATPKQMADAIRVLAMDGVEKAKSGLEERGFAVRSMWPADGFKDWNDQLRGVRA